MKQKNNPLITVIMSAYNSEKYLAEAIESITNQTFKDFEFIIFEDGSKDNTREILKKYSKKDSRIIPIYNNKNIGYVGFIRNLNRGLKMSRGKYIARMDSDDISLQNRFKIQYEYLEKNPNIFLVGSSFELIEENNRVLSKEINGYDSEVIAKKLPSKSVIHHPTVMFRNEKNTYYREKAMYCEDRDLWLRFLSENKKMAVLPIILLKYRIHSSSVCMSSTTKQKLFLKKVIEWYFERKKYGKDNYNVFNINDILRLNENREGEKQVNICKLKLLFKNDNEMKNFRKELLACWQKNGINIWKIGIIYYCISFLPSFLIKKIKRIIWH